MAFVIGFQSNFVFSHKFWLEHMNKDQSPRIKSWSMDRANDEKNISGQGHRNDLGLWPFRIQESSSVGKTRKVLIEN